MSVEEFLKRNPDLDRSQDELGAATDISLSVVVRGVTSSFVDFAHMGLNYRAALKDVIRLEQTEHSSLGAKSATISFNRDAVLVVQRAVSAVDVANAIPFGFERLSPVSEGSGVQSARERAWMRATGYDTPRGHAVNTAMRTFATGTKCDGKIDDERADQFAQIEESDRFAQVSSATDMRPFATATLSDGIIGDERADQFAIVE